MRPGSKRYSRRKKRTERTVQSAVRPGITHTGSRTLSALTPRKAFFIMAIPCVSGRKRTISRLDSSCCFGFFDLKRAQGDTVRHIPALLRLFGYFKLPSPPMSAVIFSMRLSGNGGSHSGRMAMLISFIGLSSAATRLELSAPQRRQRWMIAHSPPLRTHTAIGSMMPPQSDSRSPGSMSNAGCSDSSGNGCGDRCRRSPVCRACRIPCR